MTRRDLRYAARAKRAGAHHVLKTIQEARRAGLPLSWAFALVEQESAFRNVFGHDAGSILAGQRVTKRRVARLVRHVKAGGVSNGVGLTQLTSLDLILSANTRGGAHRPRIQLREGFEFFNRVTGRIYSVNAWHYNGARSYQAEIAAKQARWHKILSPPGR